MLGSPGANDNGSGVAAPLELARLIAEPMDQYDHQTKAGNEGDVVKNPALIAALDGLLAKHEGLFRYFDAIAARGSMS